MFIKKGKKEWKVKTNIIFCASMSIMIKGSRPNNMASRTSGMMILHVNL